jgi:protease II
MQKHVRYYKSRTDSPFRKKGVVYKSIAIDKESNKLIFEVNDKFNIDKWKQIDYICSNINSISKSECYYFYLTDFDIEIDLKQTLNDLQKELVNE